MLVYIKEHAKYVEITGFKNIEFVKVDSFLKANRKQTQNVNTQFFDADLIATQEHLYFAVLNALQAFDNKINFSKTPAMETMLYASAQRQIQKAIERSGIKPKTKNMAVALIGEDPIHIQSILDALTKCVETDVDETVLEMTKTKETKIKKAFNIQNEELKILEGDNQRKAIVNLVIEQVSLLAVK